MSHVPPEQAKQPAEQRNAAPCRTRLRSMLSTDELLRRPSRPPNYAAENQALVALAQEMATSPEGILQRLADTALSLRALRRAQSPRGWRPKEQFSLARYRRAVGSSCKRRNTAQFRPVRHGP